MNKTTFLAAAQTLRRDMSRHRRNAMKPIKKGFEQNHFFGAAADAAAGYVPPSA
ncbi:hypothetical protein [Comamonas kerstersii]|uniref:hypothetical protein n=1 Tax=Comamonas kerstersii TaxID=225992 RepID=UPI0014780689|nr:hypothetical protein [Comamonas kerstersii]